MSADRNKTNITHEITERAARWLELIGAKCVETEVCVGAKWIADLAAYWRPTRTEAVAQKLIPRAKSYPYGYGAADSLMREYQESLQAHHEAYRALPGIITIVVEVKTSRSDLKKDLSDKFMRPPVADLQIIAAQRDLLRIDEALPTWWYLGFTENDIDILRRPLTPTSVEQKLDFVAAVGERRHNRTANEFWSALGKRRRLEDAELKKSFGGTCPASAL